MQRLNICASGGILASLLMTGCTTGGTLKDDDADQAAGPPDAVIFISGMS